MSAEARVIMLGPDGWEESLGAYENVNGERLDPRFRTMAAEVAPGVHVWQLSEGGGIGPDGERRVFGARVVVWADDQLGQLRAALADLHGYIEKRAEELATPLIESAAENARQMVAQVEESAKAEIQRLQDLVTEKDRRLAGQDRRRGEMRGYHDRLAAALGRSPHFYPWASLVADIEKRLKEETDG